MTSVALTGLMQVDLPGRALRFCDGGFLTVGSETFAAADDVFGTIAGMNTMAEGVGDTVPAFSFTLLPPQGSAPAQLSQAGNQTARVRMWIAEYVPETGAVVSKGATLFDGQIDQTVMTVGGKTRTLDVSVVSLAERLFEGNIGNTLNPMWHKSVWPNETGHDHATGLGIPDAWGTEGPGGSGGSGPMRGDGGGGRSYDGRPNLRAY